MTCGLAALAATAAVIAVWSGYWLLGRRPPRGPDPFEEPFGDVSTRDQRDFRGRE